MANIDQVVIEDWVQKVSECTNLFDAEWIKIPNDFVEPVLRRLYEIRCLKDSNFSDKARQETALVKLEYLFKKHRKNPFRDDIRQNCIKQVFFKREINYVVDPWEKKINSSSDFFELFKNRLGLWCYLKWSAGVDSPSDGGRGKVDMKLHFPEDEAKRLSELARRKMDASKDPESSEDTKIQKLCLQLESKNEVIWKGALAELELIFKSKNPNAFPDQATKDILDKINIILTRNPHWRSQMHEKFDSRY